MAGISRNIAGRACSPIITNDSSHQFVNESEQASRPPRRTFNFRHNSAGSATRRGETDTAITRAERMVRWEHEQSAVM